MLQEVPEYAKMHYHMMTLLDVLGSMGKIRFIFYPRVKSQISLSSVQEVAFIAHRIRIPEILPWDRNFYLTQAILPRLSREGYIIG